eukprot:m.457480 g.457480  ORF g.457480 m.457480 type:complete len:120 (-) comp21270_c0_seq1:144-503(-)
MANADSDVELEEDQAHDEFNSHASSRDASVSGDAAGGQEGLERLSQNGGNLRKPRSAYMHFYEDIRESIKAQNPEMKVTDVAKECGFRWKNLAPAEKKQYEELAAQQKARYLAAVRGEN